MLLAILISLSVGATLGGLGFAILSGNAYDKGYEDAKRGL